MLTSIANFLRRHFTARISAVALVCLMSPAATGTKAQTGPVSLIADNVSFDQATGVLTASGNVEVLNEERILLADQITYNSESEKIRATGNVSLTDPDGSVFLAESVELSSELNDGIIEGARLLIAGQMQLAANEVRRHGDRFTTLHNTVASSCTVCANNPTPTWAIRADRVTQDEQEQRIYFEDARFELFGYPIGYVPALSIPDPRVKRASGLMIPEYKASNIYGSGVKLPYYMVLGPYGDAMVTPFVTTKGSMLFEGEYRRNFSNGTIRLDGVLAVNDGLGETGRGAYNAEGEFRLTRGFMTDFSVSHASDDSFLQQFDYSDDDRLTSTARIYRVRQKDFVHLGGVGFQSLREDEDNSAIPLILPEFAYQRNITPDGAPGLLRVSANSLGVIRETGRDMFRAGGGINWRLDTVQPMGILTAITAETDLDVYSTWNDPEINDGLDTRAVPAVAVELRWPFLRATSGATHVIEPVAQFIYSDALGTDNIPNEDSQLPELDEYNLFSLNRYPGRDAVETGLRANVGIKYTRYDPAGWNLGATFGRVMRAEADENFAPGTGLSGRWSDYVGALSLDFSSGLSVRNRALISDSARFRRNEFELGFDGQNTEIEASYTFLAEDNDNPILGPQPETNEFGIEADYRFHPNWKVHGLWRYDAQNKKSLRAGGGFTYGNECAEFDLSVSRRFTSSSNVPPSTSVSFGLRLSGLGDSGKQEWPTISCVLRGI